MTRLLLFVKHRLPAVWKLVEWINTSLFALLHGERLESEASICFREFDLEGYEFRALIHDDLQDLERLLDRQGERRVEYFQPHGFDRDALEQAFANPPFLMFGVFAHDDIVGYFFLRCFWNWRCFVGRLIDEAHEKRGVGRIMNDIMYHTAWRSGFRCHTTISKNNAKIMRSHENNPAARIIKELPDDYLLIEFVETGPVSQRNIT